MFLSKGISQSNLHLASQFVIAPHSKELGCLESSGDPQIINVYLHLMLKKQKRKEEQCMLYNKKKKK